jgi:hypothetical protein
VQLYSQYKVFGWLFLLTGIFSIISSLFAWGEGWLFSIVKLDSFLIPMADFITIGPLSLISAFGIFKAKNWGFKFGTITAGAYIYGSILVFIILLWHGKPYSIKLIIPSVAGFMIGFSFLIYVLKRS